MATGQEGKFWIQTSCGSWEGWAPLLFLPKTPYMSKAPSAKSDYEISEIYSIHINKRLVVFFRESSKRIKDIKIFYLFLNYYKSISMISIASWSHDHIDSLFLLPFCQPISFFFFFFVHQIQIFFPPFPI